MTRAISQEEFIATVPEVLSAVSESSFIIRSGDTFVAAVVSEQDYELIRRARGERAIAAMNRMRDSIEASGASEEELRELERALDRKA